ncbi:hypothetical protein J2Y46_000142 [Microbacterium sp. BE35]|uniref:hypothetical protein n=1 Tax=Microbacterium sp. BE35 TaxID=2817773 RepID=UPI002859AB2F|nr:hypothetical protein [Microbacterium sp. BE35]MDR7187326.1 hypothetical protein [Microbacterium sp. BE35]
MNVVSDRRLIGRRVPSTLARDVDKVRCMASDVTLYIGPETAYRKFRFTDVSEWETVRSQIVAAMEAGRGLIEIPWKGDTVVFVYSPYLMVTWVEKRPE